MYHKEMELMQSNQKMALYLKFLDILATHQYYEYKYYMRPGVNYEIYPRFFP